VTFDRFEVDLIRRRLRKDGRVVRLQPKPFLILARLLERPGEVVTREQLVATLWTGETHVEFDAGLNTAIRKLRRALGDSAADARFIQTVPGIGYRFIGPVPQPAAENGDSHLFRENGDSHLFRENGDSHLFRDLRPYARLAAVTLLIVFLSPAASHRAIAESAFMDDACALARVKQPQLALRTIERGLAMYPRSAALRAHRGLYLHAVGRYDDEMSALLDAVALDPRSAEAQFHLGLGYARRRAYAESLTALERAVVLDPNQPRYRSWLDLIAADARTPPADPRTQGPRNPGT
jgi:DNA-binding winged helix-turn-helix (wHTH) protein